MNDNVTVVGGSLIAIIAIIIAVLSALRTKPGTPAASPVEKKEADIAQKKIDDAKAVEQKDIQQAKDAHDKAVEDVITKEEKQVDKADDSQATNDFLKDIGGKVKS